MQILSPARYLGSLGRWSVRAIQAISPLHRPLATLLFISLIPMPALAQDPGVSIIHSPPRANELPDPAVPVKLVFNLGNTKKFDYRAQILMVRDGEFMEQWIPKGTLDIRERPLYEVMINAPLRSLKYELVLYDDNQIIATSSPFEMRRSCKPLISTEELGPVKNDDIVSLAKASRVLEREIALYEQSLTLLEELKNLVGEEEQNEAPKK